MLSTVFLSFSSMDGHFVENVHRHLPDGLAYFYPKSFENGEELISAMEARVGESTIFALFASKASLDSVWVQFEIFRARVAKIVKPNFRVLVFPIDRDIDFTRIPDWMKEYWIGTSGISARDIARYIRGLLLSLPTPLSIEPFGRGALFDLARRKVQNSLLQNKIIPNVYVFGGNAGIGRRTFQNLFFEKAFPAHPNLNFGPVFTLQQFADLVDIYRSVREEVEEGFTLSGFAADQTLFEGLSITDQIAEILKNFQHFGDLGQAVTIVTGNGLFEDQGVLKHWVPPFFEALRDAPKITVTIISNRLLHDRELRPHQNVMQLQVDSIDDDEIKSLISTFIPIFGGVATLPSDVVIKTIGGHPSVARAVSRLIAEKGTLVINHDLKELHDVQEEILSESLNFSNLTELEKDALSILSWVPQLSGNILSRVLRERHSIDVTAVSEVVNGLLLACLLQISGEYYSISSPIRAIFRKKHGYGSSELMQTFSAALKDEWEKAKRDDQLKGALLDAIIFMYALEGGSLPPELRGLILPSTLQGVVKEAYDRRHSDDTALKRAIDWGLPAIEMKMDEAVKEDILSNVFRSQVRLGRYSDADKTLMFMSDANYRSVPYLTSFRIRLSGGDLNEALNYLSEAKKIRKYMKSVISDTAICLKKLGKWRELENLLADQVNYIDKNMTLLDIYIGNLISKANFNLAEEKIELLRSMDDRGMADARTASLMIRRDHNFDGAEKLLTRVINTSAKGVVGLRRLRALAAAKAGHYSLARQDVQSQLGKPGGEDTAFRIEAEIKLHQNNFKDAHAEFAKITKSTAQDMLFLARLYETEAVDLNTSLTSKTELLRIAGEIRASHGPVDEFDIDAD